MVILRPSDRHSDHSHSYLTCRRTSAPSRRTVLPRQPTHGLPHTDSLTTDIAFLRADGEADSLLFFPDRFRQAMKLDERLLDLLTDANEVRITSEKVVAIVEQVFDALMSDTFVDEKQYVPDTSSFDLSKYLLDDGALICLFQMAKYLDMCACVSHLGLQCICHREDFGLVNMNCQMDGTFIPRTGKHRNKSE